jgi:quercetin dioxygenase-like cupin family protein
MLIRPSTLLFAASLLCLGSGIPVEKFDLSHTKPGVHIQPVLAGAVPEVALDLVTLVGPGRHTEAAARDHAVVWLVLSGQGRMSTKKHAYEVAGETILRAPQGWAWQIETTPGEILRVLRIRRSITPQDRAEFAKFARNNAAPHVRKFSECEPYTEAIKSPKTISRTLLPENFVPRMALGTVETTGPDSVGLHSHPMLEQFFLGLEGNDITVLADDDRANLTGFAILHIPLGSNHGAEVAEGKKLHYVWMDFFQTREGQEWLKMHKPIEPEP